MAQNCKNEGHVVNCTNETDSHERFIRGRNAYCIKENEPFENKKLSEIIDTLEKNKNRYLKGGIEINKKIYKKAIERFGDITYKEFLTEKIYEMNINEIL